MRAGEGGKQAVLGKQLSCLQMKLTVSAQGIGDSLARAGEGRGIEDDQIVLFLASGSCGEKLKNIRTDDLNGNLIELCVRLDPGQIFFSGFHGGDFCGPRLGAGDGKSTLIREAVEHSAALRPSSHLSIAGALVEIEAGLLPIDRVKLEFHSRDRDLEGARLRSQKHPCPDLESFQLAR